MGAGDPPRDQTRLQGARGSAGVHSLQHQQLDLEHFPT